VLLSPPDVGCNQLWTRCSRLHPPHPYHLFATAFQTLNLFSCVSLCTHIRRLARELTLHHFRSRKLAQALRLLPCIRNALGLQLGRYSDNHLKDGHIAELTGEITGEHIALLAWRDRKNNTTQKTKHRGLSPQANYIYRAPLVGEVSANFCRVVSETDPYGRILGFLDLNRHVFFQVAPQLY
jgi:hypothetical protein